LRPLRRHQQLARVQLLHELGLHLRVLRYQVPGMPCTALLISPANVRTGHGSKSKPAG
jgi:hypothetical protein